MNGMDLTFLGTGAGLPSKERNVTSIALGFPEYDGNLWLFDCGEGTQRQILSSSVKLTKLKVIFITHLHGDHLFGLPGVLGSRSFQGAETPLLLIGPVGLKKFVETALNVSRTHIRYPIAVRECSRGGRVFEDEHFFVDARPLDHGILSFGYQICERDQPGELLVDKLRKLGIPPGPIYKTIKDRPEVVLPDGHRLKTAPFIGEKKKGRRIAVIGDTRPCPAVLSLAEQADLMIHEATFRQESVQLARAYHHSTSVQAAQAALSAGVRTLILTHLSARYQKNEQIALLKEARTVFEHTHLAADLWTYHLNRQPRR